MARLLSAQLIVTPLLCALIDVLTTGEEVCWAELPPGTNGGISPPPQLHLTMLANCLRDPMSDRLRLAGYAHHVHIAAFGRLRAHRPG